MRLLIGKDYRLERRKSYPSVAEQLDMLWHAMDEGNVPVAEPWYSTIKAVKEKHPKKRLPRDIG